MTLRSLLYGAGILSCEEYFEIYSACESQCLVVLECTNAQFFRQCLLKYEAVHEYALENRSIHENTDSDKIDFSHTFTLYMYMYYQTLPSPGPFPLPTPCPLHPTLHPPLHPIPSPWARQVIITYRIAISMFTAY